MFGLGALLNLVPSLVNGVVTAWNKGKDVTIAGYQASVGIAQASVQGMSLWIGHPLSPPAIMAYGAAIWFFKASAYDNVISYWITGRSGYTAPLTGDTRDIAMIVVTGMFFSGIANILKR